MSPENQPNTTKICPTCGTRLGINATRCSVCGSNLAPSVAVASAKAVSGPRIPEVTLSLPIVFGLGVLLLVIGAGVVYAILQGLGGKSPATAGAAATITPTRTTTVTVTMTPTVTQTPTLQPTATLEPPVEYKVATGDTCGGIAYNFGVSVNSIVVLNGLSSDCTNLSVGQTLKIPKPTPTPSPMPSNTPNATEIAAIECNTVDVTVKDGDTLGGIAANYAVSPASVQKYNGMTNDVVYVGQKLKIPLCEQQLETPSPTPVPPYAGPNLLLPADGAFFTNPAEPITLQWASVGDLRQNESYAITVEDVTAGEARKWIDYSSDTKYNVPSNYAPTDKNPHVYRWTVLPVRQTGTDKETGKPLWEPAGDVSAQRVFTWVGSGNGGQAPAPTETPKPQ